MSFYDLSKGEREQKYIDIQNEILHDLIHGEYSSFYKYFNDTDTYVRKAGYLGLAKLYKADETIRASIIKYLERMIDDKSERVRQTVINACGEIAKMHFGVVEHLFEIGLQDRHHSVRNAIQGSIKKSGEKNHTEVIEFCRKHITSETPEIRRQVAHGLELRGRKYPEDILPILKLLQFEKHRRVRPMIIHIIGQISYKNGCLEKVTRELLTWEDKELADACFNEIIEQHRHVNSHFKTVQTLSPKECEEYIKEMRK